MKIGIIGASGKSGKFLLTESVARGHEVTAIVRRSDFDFPEGNVLVKDIFSLTTEDLIAFDVVIDAFGTWEPATLPLHQETLEHLSTLLSNTQTRLLVVGSAGGLFVDPEQTLRLLDSPEMPELYKPLSTAMTAAYDELIKRQDVLWTYFSPAAFFDVDGPRTNQFTLGQDNLLLNAQGESYLSYADGAIIMIDESEKGNFIQQRFTAITN